VRGAALPGRERREGKRRRHEEKEGKGEERRKQGSEKGTVKEGEGKERQEKHDP